MTLVRPAFRVLCLRKSLGAIYRLGLRAYHQPGKLNHAPGSQFCLRRLLFSSTSSSLIDPRCPSSPHVRGVAVRCSACLAARFASGWETAVSCPLAVAVATVSFAWTSFSCPIQPSLHRSRKPSSSCLSGLRLSGLPDAVASGLCRPVLSRARGNSCCRLLAASTSVWTG
jgi:hypothetical protein